MEDLYEALHAPCSSDSEKTSCKYSRLRLARKDITLQQKLNDIEYLTCLYRRNRHNDQQERAAAFGAVRGIALMVMTFSRAYFFWSSSSERT